MRVSIIKIGNSHGVRIPKPILKQCGFKDEVELEIHDHELVIKATSAPRKNWENAFRVMAAKGDDNLLDPEVVITSKWDKEEWEWK